MYTKAFAICADIWVVLAFTVADYNEFMQAISITLAAVSSLIVIVPWVVKQICNAKTRRKKVSGVRKAKNPIQ